MKRAALIVLSFISVLIFSLGNFGWAESLPIQKVDPQVDYGDDPVPPQDDIVVMEPTDTPAVNQQPSKDAGGIYHGTPCQSMTADLKVERFESGKLKGWKVKLPENLPLASPAIADGALFIGGGFGSYSFYALDAYSGNLKWAVRTGDDGPTAAVVHKGRVLFNTESCILYCLDANNGHEIWNWWLGDPLMSQPGAYEDKVYIAYPSNTGHRLACLALVDGAVEWTQSIVGELISAPVINDGAVYATCLEGTVYKFDYGKGALAWVKQNKGTSAPFVYNDQVYLSMRTEKTEAGEVVMHEGLGGMGGGSGEMTTTTMAETKADYLDISKQGSGAAVEKQAALDAAVGFSTAPASAKMEQAAGNLGVSSVSGVWSYQGSRPVIKDGISYNAQGDRARAVDVGSGRVLWEKEYKGANEGGGARAMTPPALVNGKMIFGTSDGKIICLSAKDGKELWSVDVGSPVRFTPSVMYGRVYAGTETGYVVCLETGDKKDTGWAMWGGNASHNGWQFE